MKIYLVIFCTLVASTAVYGQNARTLDYKVIDSLLKVYIGQKKYDKGLELALSTVAKSEGQDSLQGEYWDIAAYYCELKRDYSAALGYYKKSLNASEQSLQGR